MSANLAIVIGVGAWLLTLLAVLAICAAARVGDTQIEASVEEARGGGGAERDAPARLRRPTRVLR